jgi:hypothetical protein
MLSGCYLVSFDDVSAKAPYSNHVGKHYRSVETAYIHRVSLDQNYKPTPSAYVVYGRRMATSGPEVVSHAELPIGTTFQVLKVMRCTNCFLDFGERVEAVVKITSADRFNDTEDRVSTTLLGLTFIEGDTGASRRDGA